MSVFSLFPIFLLACGAAAATGVIFKPGPWYDRLIKPEFTPPNWLFPVAWTVIYALIAWAGARLAQYPESGAALALWSAQIALNTLWTPVFFGAHRMRAGMIIISLLFLTVLVLMVVAFGIDFWAGMMIVPYMAWLCVAAALNWRIWQDNKDRLQSPEQPTI